MPLPGEYVATSFQFRQSQQRNRHATSYIVQLTHQARIQSDHLSPAVGVDVVRHLVALLEFFPKDGAYPLLEDILARDGLRDDDG